MITTPRAVRLAHPIQTHGRRGRPRLHRIGVLAARFFAGLMLFCLALAASGAGYEAIASRQDAVRYPAPGRLVDVGGYRLHLNCVGQGGPTVVLDAGAGEIGTLAWGSVPTDLEASSRVCTYDRAGFGWSEPGPMPRTASQIVAELHTLLTNAGESGPYVLVGHSLGGKHVRLFAGQYPSEVTGMVLVDARHEDVDAPVGSAAVQAEISQVEQFRALQVVLRRFGVTRALGPWLLAAAAPPELSALPMEYFLLQGAPAAAEANVSEIRSFAESDTQLRAEAGTLANKPLIVLMRGKPSPDADFWSAWQASQHAMAGLSTRGQLVVAQRSGHVIQLEEPELVVSSVRQTIAASREPV
jgi:pimeloyl-ACP methyl ester carboxylesterase